MVLLHLFLRTWPSRYPLSPQQFLLIDPAGLSSVAHILCAWNSTNMHSCRLSKRNCNFILALALVLRCSGLSLSLSMSSGPSQAGTTVSRTGFLKAASVSLVGAGLGVGVIGQPVEQVHAAEPLVETCEEAISLILLLPRRAV